MAAWNIAIVGATGQVGQALLEQLPERNFSIEQVALLASDNSAGETVRFQGKNLTVKNIDDFDWSFANFAFFVANAKVAEQYAQQAAEAGCTVIDLSGYFALDESIPLVVPGVNDFVLAEYRNANIISVADAVVCQLLKALQAITSLPELTQLHVTNFIPASYYGAQGVKELAGQSAQLLNGLPAESKLFYHQLAFNLLPMTEHNNPKLNERVLVEQVKRVLGHYQLALSFDSIAVPVFYGLAQSVHANSVEPLMIEHLAGGDLAQNSKEPQPQVSEIEFVGQQIPTLISEINAGLNLKVGNLRYSYAMPEQVQFWSVADNVRYLGARMAIETLERLINSELTRYE